MPTLADRTERFPLCVDCGAQLQEYRNLGVYMRCPWARPERWKIDTYHVVTRITCNWPRSGEKWT